MIDTAEKKKILKDHGQHEKDTGSSQVQIAIMTARIKELTEHFKTHTKDHHSRRGLLRLVGRRRKLLEYLKKKDREAHKELIAKLGIRK